MFSSTASAGAPGTPSPISVDDCVRTLGSRLATPGATAAAAKQTLSACVGAANQAALEAARAVATATATPTPLPAAIVKMPEFTPDPEGVRIVKGAIVITSGIVVALGGLFVKIEYEAKKEHKARLRDEAIESLRIASLPLENELVKQQMELIARGRMIDDARQHPAMWALACENAGYPVTAYQTGEIPSNLYREIWQATYNNAEFMAKVHVKTTARLQKQLDELGQKLSREHDQTSLKFEKLTKEIHMVMEVVLEEYKRSYDPKGESQ